MIYDAENMFMTKQDLAESTTSDVVYNGGGDAYTALWLHALADSELSADATITIETSDTEDMADAVEIGTLALAKDEGSTAAVRMPKGGKKYYRLTVSGASSGKMTAALVFDVELN